MRAHGLPARGLAAVAAALMLAACGGSSASPSRAAFIQRASAVCEDAFRAVRNVAPPVIAPGQPLKLAALAAYLRQVSPILAAELRELKALPQPTANRGLLRRYLAAVSTEVAQYRTLAAAAGSGDAAGVARTKQALAGGTAADLGRSYGLRACSASSASA